MTLRWASFDKDGTFLTELVSLEPQYPMRRVIGASSAGTATLYLNGIPQRNSATGLPDLSKPALTDAAPGEWENLTEGAANLIGCWDDTDPGQTPQWVGLVWKRTRNTSTDTVDLGLSTAESYLDARLVGDYSVTATGQNAIIQAIVQQFVVPDGGLPFTVLTVTTGDGKTRKRTYKTSEYTSAYQRMQELSSANAGPEWTVEWAWDATRTKIIPSLLVGDRIGTAAADGVPVAVFDMPGCLRDLTMTEDYTPGKGANVVTAYSSGAGKSIPTSGPVEGNRGRKLRVDFAKQPVASQIDRAELLDHAEAILSRLAPGSIGVDLVGDLAASPRLGQDWRLGDDLGVHVDSSVKAFPAGLDLVTRALGVEIAADTITPLFVQNSET